MLYEMKMKESEPEKHLNIKKQLTEDKITSFSSSGNKAGTIPEVNMLLINSKNPE